MFRSSCPFVQDYLTPAVTMGTGAQFVVPSGGAYLHVGGPSALGEYRNHAWTQPPHSGHKELIGATRLRGGFCSPRATL